MNEGVIAVLIIFGLMALASLVGYIDNKKPKMKGVQPRVEVHEHKRKRHHKVSA